MERYLTWLILYKSEAQGSMKLLLRNYNKQPKILVLLLNFEDLVTFKRVGLSEKTML